MRHRDGLAKTVQKDSHGLDCRIWTRGAAALPVSKSGYDLIANKVPSPIGRILYFVPQLNRYFMNSTETVVPPTATSVVPITL